MEWSLYNKDNYLKPLIFSNGKSQLDVVKEVIEAIKEGHKIIFIKGACGSGKSAIALNIAKELGKASIVVPVKALQKQYEEDYVNKLHITKDNKKLNISIIDGRTNHKCIFRGDCSADAVDLPCKIMISNRNATLIKQYIKQNPFVDSKNFNNITDVRRKSIAPACPYWSPIICDEWFEDYKIEDAEEIKYKGLGNKKFTYYERKKGCSYYNQFTNYINADVIIFNSKKYELENLMDRKPSTEVEIIDECDEFLDNLSTEKKINLDRLSRNLANVRDEDLKELTIEINDLIIEILKEKNDDISLIKDTKVYQLLKYFLDNPSLADLTDDEFDYFYQILQIGRSFENFFDETYINFSKNENDSIVSLITINLEKKLKEFLDKNKVFVMMSGTVHSKEVLNNIFGIKDFKVIEAEVEDKGKIEKLPTGLERTFNYILLKQKDGREHYLEALSKCVKEAEKPILIQVNSFYDLPNSFECNRYDISNLKTRDELKDEQNKYKKGELVQKFKEGKIDVLYSTKCTRGVDFPKEMCNSIIFTKYPYSNISSLFWRILKKSKPMFFDMFYIDKARRELYQRIYRGLRSEDDHIYLLSPDLRVLKAFAD
tara:strand:- start:1435 stop:3237 length:1803 start_codon:yes stop_codon:yes gene_type:complete